MQRIRNMRMTYGEWWYHRWRRLRRTCGARAIAGDFHPTRIRVVRQTTHRRVAYQAKHTLVLTWAYDMGVCRLSSCQYTGHTSIHSGVYAYADRAVVLIWRMIRQRRILRIHHSQPPPAPWLAGGGGGTCLEGPTR
eukprot:3942003-Rhodomonas_salina.4